MAKTKKTGAKKRSVSKARVTKKASASKRPTSKKRVSAGARATKKTMSSKRSPAKKPVSPKAKATSKRTASKWVTAKKSSTPKVKATSKKSAPKRVTAKKSMRPRVKATSKKTASKWVRAKKSMKPRVKVTSKKTASKWAAAKKSSMPKVKATSEKAASKRVRAKKSIKPKVKATRKATVSKRVRARKSVVPKVTRKAVASKRATPRKSVAPKVKATGKPMKKVTQRQSPAKARTEFDFHTWLLPTLALEQYEPHVEQEVGVGDHIKGSTRYAWIGAGQCGGRLVKSFYDLGYKKVLAVNTTHHDLDLLDIPKNQKFLMDIGEKGAGKDVERGQEAVQHYQQEILHLARQTFGSQVDHIMIGFGAGGGTGSGSVVGLIEIAKRYARYIGLRTPDKNVGVIMTLPTVGEAGSPLVAENAYNIACELSQMAAAGQISPLIIVDNDKINKMYPGMTVRSFWPSINNTVASLFDIFNRLSALSSQYTSFDPVDYHSIMEAGGCAIMGLTKVSKLGDKFAISEAVKKNLEKTLLAGGFDLSTAKLAGCIVVGGRKLMTSAKGLQDNIDYAFDVLSEITGHATIHRGIYEDGRDSLRVYTIIGGLDACTARLEELKSHTLVEVR